jgi:phosphatidylserine/phosphatidylglycerophosphate/cardiolipin synthase-like enzyme
MTVRNALIQNAYTAPEKRQRVTGHPLVTLYAAASAEPVKTCKAQFSISGRQQDNMPGYTDARLGPLASPYKCSKRQKYCIDWWSRYLPEGSGTSSNPNLQIVLRDMSIAAARDGLADEEDSPTTSEALLLEGFGTHHQKPVLIDYAYDGGSKAVGYVMGLNSVTDFWDRTAHEIDDSLRELWESSSVDEEIKHETATEGKISKAVYSHAKPYQDYACRLVGPALERLHQNFVRSWNRNAPATWHMTELASPPPKIPTQPSDPAQAVQVVRTQPEEKEKSIKELYLQAASYARNYIYIENQYFFYPTFARHLKEARRAYCKAWSRCSGKPALAMPVLHVFIVIPHPEDDGLVPRTYDMLTELGASDTMPEQRTLLDDEHLSQNYPDAKTVTYSLDTPEGPMTLPRKVLDRTSVRELAATYGMKVSVARLRTSGHVESGMAYREVYIHSKLMIIDDVFLTVGSANLDQRSMASDSEINVGVTGVAHAAELRERVFGLNSGGEFSGSGSPAELPDVFKRWGQLMQKNVELRQSGKTMKGFLLPFEDCRATGTMHASVTVPSSGNTEYA